MARLHYMHMGDIYAVAATAVMRHCCQLISVHRSWQEACANWQCNAACAREGETCADAACCDFGPGYLTCSDKNLCERPNEPGPGPDEGTALSRTHTTVVACV